MAVGQAVPLDTFVPELVVTSPPYWTSRSTAAPTARWGGSRTTRSFLGQLDQVWRMCHTALVPGDGSYALSAMSALRGARTAASTRSCRCTLRSHQPLADVAAPCRQAPHPAEGRGRCTLRSHQPLADVAAPCRQAPHPAEGRGRHFQTGGQEIPVQWCPLGVGQHALQSPEPPEPAVVDETDARRDGGFCAPRRQPDGYQRSEAFSFRPCSGAAPAASRRSTCNSRLNDRPRLMRPPTR